ncbi:hypothetical protein CBS101457_000620 [Exobasidium rhododendri]|nr:hypothetical protein CBS101457_000620 [Exobasidium rhododendri]
MPSIRRSPSSSPSLSSSTFSQRVLSHPVLDEQFLPRIVSIFYSIFHPTEGAKIVYQVPEEVISTATAASQPREASVYETDVDATSNHQISFFNFNNVSEFIIPQAPLCGRLISYSVASPNGQNYKILSHPVILLDQAKYPRKSFIFNLAFVFDGRADTRAYEPIVRKCARELKDLEISSSFLSKSQYRMYVVIEQLFEDLNSYCESFVALPEAPHTKYANEAIKGAATHDGGQGEFSYKGNGRLSASNTPNSPFTLDNRVKKTEDEKGESECVSLNQGKPAEAGEQTKVPPVLTIGEPILPTEARPATRRSSTDHPSSPDVPSNQDDFNESRDRKSSGSWKDPTTAATTSPNSRPGVGRRKTFAALAISETTVNAIPSSTGLDVAEKKQSEHGDSEAMRKGASAMTRTFSSETESRYVGSTTSHLDQISDENDEMVMGLDESILSLRAVGVSSAKHHSSSPAHKKTNGGEKSTNASIGAMAPAAMLAPGKREPPHGLGRTVRDAINLKLFPTYPNPKEIHDWEVPVTLLDLKKRVTGNWDLTMCKVLPFIDGVNHVKRIAQLADSDLELTRQCIEHLLYYRCIITIDTFQFTNMYTVRPSIAVMAEDEVIIAECAIYVTKPGHTLPTWPKLLGLYSSLRPATTLNDWIEENDVEALGIDVRRFVSFGVIKGFLRRIHRYPILLHLHSSPVFRHSSREIFSSPSAERDQSNSRSRERMIRVREEDVALHGAQYRRSSLSPDTMVREAFAQRSGRRGPRQASENESLRGFGGGNGSIASSGDRRKGGEQGVLRKTRATVLDVANVALEAAREQEHQASHHISARVSIRTPIQRGGSNATLRANALVGSRDSDEAHHLTTAGGSSTLGTTLLQQSKRQQGVVKIPLGFVDLLDGTHPDDEFCVRFGMSWNDVLTILVVIGRLPDLTAKRQSMGMSGRGTEQDEEGGGGGVALHSGWQSDMSGGGGATGGGGGGEGDESAFGNISGFYGPPLSSVQRRSIGGHLPRYRKASIQANQSGLGQSGFSQYANTGDTNSAWGSRSSNIQSNSSAAGREDHQSDLKRMAIGDLGRIKIILK